jgi:hypothetical protein
VVKILRAPTAKGWWGELQVNRDLLPWIKARQTKLLDNAAFFAAADRLTALHQTTHRPTAKREHLAQLKARGK